MGLASRHFSIRIASAILFHARGLKDREENVLVSAAKTVGPIQSRRKKRKAYEKKKKSTTGIIPEFRP